MHHEVFPTPHRAHTFLTAQESPGAGAEIFSNFIRTVKENALEYLKGWRLKEDKEGKDNEDVISWEQESQ